MSTGREVGSSCRSITYIAALVLLAAPPRGLAAQAQFQDSLSREKARLEIQKLRKELDDRGISAWLLGIGGLLVGVGGTLASLWAGRRARIGELDQSVHDKRLESYPELVKATAPLALYFPEQSASRLDPQACADMGRIMSSWYFNGGGLLLSQESRNAYFRLARALTRASLAGEIDAPRFPTDAGSISSEFVSEYRNKLAERYKLHDVEKWPFGGSSADSSDAFRFKDYVFLQHLSSDLRTELSGDVRSRRRPAD